MDFSFPPEAERLRNELGRWLDENLTPDVVDAGRRRNDDDAFDCLRRWNHRLADAGFATIAWPAEFGGRAANGAEQLVFFEEMRRRSAPGPINTIGVNNIAPALMTFGTAEQQTRHLVQLARGDDIWCQGMSEPGAGSDLAGLSTRAVAVDGGFRVTGQKIWTTLGHRADWCQLYVRTDPTAGKHAGITCLLVDMRSPGIEARALRTMAGDADFAEVFFDDVFVPGEQVLGEVDAGWAVATTTLRHERVNIAGNFLVTESRLQGLVQSLRAAPGDQLADAAVRERLAVLASEVEHLRWLCLAAIAGNDGGGGNGFEGSLIKIKWAEIEDRLADTIVDLLGLDGLRGHVGHDVLEIRCYSIAGGTTQVNKNVLAQRVLGLPRG